MHLQLTEPKIYGEGRELSGLGLMLSIVGGVAVLVAVLLAITVAVNVHECHVTGHRLGRAAHYVFLGGGCFIETAPGQSVPLDNYRQFTPAR
jgi:hypothetical protein